MKYIFNISIIYVFITCFVLSIFSKNLFSSFETEDNSEEIQELCEEEIDEDLTYNFQFDFFTITDSNEFNELVVSNYHQYTQQTYQEPTTEMLFSPPELNA